MFLLSGTTEQEIRDRKAETILEVIASFGRDGVEPLLRTLKSNNASTRAYAANGLGKIGAAAEDAVPHLIHTLKDDDAQVRRNAVWALQQISRQTERSIPAIADTLEDDDPEVVVQACESLQQFGPAAQVALPQLIATANRYERLYRAVPARVVDRGRQEDISLGIVAIRLAWRLPTHRSSDSQSWTRH